MAEDAEHAITRVLLSYATYADRNEPEKIVDLFTEDGELSVAGRTYAGRERLSRFFGVGKAEDVVPHRTKHVMSNIVVESDGTDIARSVTYFQVLQPTGLSAWGRYLDELRLIDGKWRIAAREVAVDGPIKEG